MLRRSAPDRRFDVSCRGARPGNPSRCGGRPDRHDQQSRQPGARGARQGRHPGRSGWLAFANCCAQDFDVPGIARFVLGRYWNQATEEQRTEYVKLFEDYIAMAYATRLGGIHRRDLQGDRQPAGCRRGDRVEPDPAPGRRRTGQSGLAPDRHGGDYKISDVSVDGISMAVTQRSEFASVIQHNGGQVQGLITMLRQKTARRVALALLSFPRLRPACASCVQQPAAG